MTGSNENHPSVLSDRVLVAVRRIIRRTDQHSRKLLQEFGMTGPQLVVLREVAAEERSASALARAVSVSLPTLSGIVARLEGRGLVARRRGDEDRRQVLISITHAGRKILEAAPAPLQKAFTDRFERLEEWEQTQILSVLQRVVAMMEADELDASPILTTGGIDATGRRSRRTPVTNPDLPPGARAKSDPPPRPA